MSTLQTPVPVPAVAAPGNSGLYGRTAECGSLDQLAADVRAGHGRALVLSGAAGVGKTALLDYLAGRAADAGCRVLRLAGARSEREWEFAGLHQMCDGLLDRAELLPVPQREALGVALGHAAGPPPNRLLLGLAVLSLLSAAASDQPLICLVDDEQWLDQASAQALGFVARRLTQDPVGLVFAAREPGTELAGLPELTVGGLRDDDARTLLAATLAGPLDTRVRDLVVAETHGNPLALLELARGLRPTQLAGGFGLPAAVPAAAKVSASVVPQLAALPALTRRLIELAATDLSGDPSLVWRAAQELCLPVHTRVSAEETGLVRFDARVRFPQLSVRAAVYQAASAAERRLLHGALAAVTDPVTDPDRRAWHRAQAATGPDEDLAAELARCAGLAQARGGLGAATAFLEHAVALTVDPALRTERILAAAQVGLQAGDFAKSQDLLTAAEAQPLDEFASAQVDLLRAQLVFLTGGSDAPALLLKAAKRLEEFDADLAREAFLSAYLAALFAGNLAAGGDLPEVSHAVRALPMPAAPRPTDILLDGLALLVTDGPAAAAPAMRRAVSAFEHMDLAAAESLRWGWLAMAAAAVAWDSATWQTPLAQQVERARAAGALGQLPVMLAALGLTIAVSGDFAAAGALAVEADTIRAVTGARAGRVTRMILASLQGRGDEAVRLIDAAIADGEERGRGVVVAHAHWAAAIGHNAAGRYDEALVAARQAVGDSTALPLALRALPELVEAATRTGQDALAHDALRRLAELARGCGTDAAHGLEARCQALLGDEAEAHYRAAVRWLGRAELRPELARAHLLYGEWLRREGRRGDAREQLRIAHEMLTELNMAAFAERACRELLATSGTVRKRGTEAGTALTAQETRIARLACDGHTNPEIGTQLYLSARTVEFHLRKVYIKLGISSRRQLHQALAARASQPASSRPRNGRPAGRRPASELLASA
jgi:DNA-binding CsgD family transcriptional regulator